MIIDTPWRTTAKLKQLKAANVTTIIRYYNYSNSKLLPEKRIEKAEADAIRKAGIRLGVVFQQRQNAAADFSKASGKKACVRSLELAAAISQPAGSTIYFSCDVDFVKQSQFDAVISFFQGVAGQMSTLPKADRYLIGCYGSGATLKHLRDKQLIDHAWLAQSTGWSGYKDFKDSKKWALLQGPSTKVSGLDVDGNEANGSFGDFA